ncbi:mechanosensitive ion channel family protein [Peristeroidobacter soli]|jgi:small-conductance mechanosensitive channel|uniref:mechanosensitive ion channel family protein n=1 Tax=Peristeroidobacter soli TaxID=2497877 RepID=UPI00101CDB66|nr:mechanosensitive ion channel domain-containing protein [Peristeroidobacter soli]
MQELLHNAGLALEGLLTPTSLLQLAAIAIAILVAWWFGRQVRNTERGKLALVQTGFQARLTEALLITSPHLAALVLIAAFGGALHALKADSKLVDLAITLSGLLLLIRFAVYVVRVSLGNRTKGWGNIITFAIWSVLALHVLGWFDPLVQAFDSVGINAGNKRITLWSVIKILFTVGAFILVAVWIARWFERRLMSMQGLALSMRIGIAKFTQAFLIGLSILLGLNAAGLDLTTLNIFTGAIGIGLGFGLQAITANFVSGFVLLMDRSIKPGDVISFTGTTGTSTEGFGWVQELRGRYVVVRDRDGVETLVPNQNLITSPVINWSYTDPRVRLKLPVRVSYKCDPEKALELLLKAAEDQPRILRDPKPVSRMMGFNDYGFDLELRFWIADPQEGVNNIRSEVNRSIWRLFKANDIIIPVAQREVVIEMRERGPVARDV